MKTYLNSYIKTLSKRREERVSTLLEEARVGKEQLDFISDRIKEAFGEYNTLVLREAQENGRILSSGPAMNLRDIHLRIQELYEMSNLISLLINSHASVLLSDVKAIEDELIAIEKMSNNFAFLLADAQAFDYAHLEPFNDERGREIGFFSEDRSGFPFSANQKATVKTDEGVLVLPKALISSHGIHGSITDSNCAGFTLQSSDLKNAYKSEDAKGWFLDIASPTPITSSLPKIENSKGAQVELEFRLTKEAPSSEIKLVPFASVPVDVVSLKLYADQGASPGQELITSPRKLDRPTTIHFPLQPVARFTVVLSQPTYERDDAGTNPREREYRVKISEIVEKRKDRRETYERSFNTRKLERKNQAEIIQGDYPISIPNTRLRSDRNPINTYYQDHINQNPNAWKARSDGYGHIMHQVVQQKGEKTKDVVRGENPDLDVQSSMLLSSDYVDQWVVDTGKPNRPGHYIYKLGLRYISIGVGRPQYRGEYISKPFAPVGDIGSIKLKAGVDNYVLTDSHRANKQLTSVEFSVSNRSNPSRDEDWIPILPADEYKVSGERLFPNDLGHATFRFPAHSSQNLTVYRNGNPFNAFVNLPGASGQIAGVILDTDTFTPEDIMTCDYYPDGDPTVVSFEAYGFEDLPLVSAFDDNGPGERFQSTGDQNIITLKHSPYVDAAEANINSAYSPVSVLLGNGEVARNLTNYNSDTNTETLPTEGYYYIHSGNSLLFNRQITTSLTVYYDYLKNNVRFRTVLRCNSRDFVSPQVDYVHIKAKTRQPDLRRL